MGAKCTGTSSNTSTQVRNIQVCQWKAVLHSLNTFELQSL